MQSQALSLAADSILAEARARTGLRDFGDASFEEPLRRLLDAMEREARLHEVGRATQRERVVGLLVNRLRAEAAFARHPEIEKEELREPFVIVGLPRTGTTMLHRTIAADPRVFALLWWESRHPAPLPDTPAAGPDPRIAAAEEGVRAIGQDTLAGGPDPRIAAAEEGVRAIVQGSLAGGPDPRIAAAEEEVRAIVQAAPELVAAHPMDAHAPDEDIMLLEHSFFSTNSEAYVHVPSFGAWLDAQDQSPGYRHLRRLLQLVQWQKRQRGESGQRWVLKTPHHLGHMDLLFQVFPDARVIQTHRDPVQTIPSLASLVYTIHTTASADVDPKRVGRHWCERMRRALDACMDFRERHPDRFLDVRYRDLVADPMAEIARIYEFVGLELTDLAASRMREWAVENARDRRPVHRYTLEQFGFTEAGIARDFARYRRRFVEPEST